MKKFFRVDKANSTKSTILLNLDWIFKIELIHSENHEKFSEGQARSFHINCMADDGVVLACLNFDSIEEAHHWVSEHLDIQL
jgi:hypothetical protein